MSGGLREPSLIVLLRFSKIAGVATETLVDHQPTKVAFASVDKGTDYQDGKGNIFRTDYTVSLDFHDFKNAAGDDDAKEAFSVGIAAIHEFDHKIYNIGDDPNGSADPGPLERTYINPISRRTWLSFACLLFIPSRGCSVQGLISRWRPATQLSAHQRTTVAKRSCRREDKGLMPMHTIRLGLLFLLFAVSGNGVVFSAYESRTYRDTRKLLSAMESVRSDSDKLAALFKVGDERIADLIRALDDSDSHISLRAQIVIRYLGNPEGLKALIEWYGKRTNGYAIDGPIIP